MEKNPPGHRAIFYMEAVCNFCLCAVATHRAKKGKSIKPIELLNQTWQLLKYVEAWEYKRTARLLFLIGFYNYKTRE
jgi:hypothetical protein